MATGPNLTEDFVVTSSPQTFVIPHILRNPDWFSGGLPEMIDNEFT